MYHQFGILQKVKLKRTIKVSTMLLVITILIQMKVYIIMIMIVIDVHVLRTKQVVIIIHGQHGELQVQQNRVVRMFKQELY